MLQDEYGVEHVMWLDDDFLFDRHETLALFNAMVRRGWRGTWDCSNGVIAASCTEEILSGATSSGCIGLILGHGKWQRVHLASEIRKPGDVRHFLNAASRLCASFQTIHSRVFLMIGFPNETLRQIKDTVDVAREMDLDWYNIAPLQALPNTPDLPSVPDGKVTRPLSGSTPVLTVAPSRRPAAGGSSFRQTLSTLSMSWTVCRRWRSSTPSGPT
jgi:hypothetical protein